MSNKKILIVEDEAQVVSFIIKGLTEENYDVSAALDGNTGLEMFKKNNFDLIILDIMLPGINGIDLCKAIRTENSNIPILFLSALGTSENIVHGLEKGADDYIVKPFKFIELVARIKSLIRRSENNDPIEDQNESYIFKIDSLTLNDYTKEVHRNGEIIQLTATEYRLLHFFLQNKERVLSRIDILDEVWGVNFDMGTNVVDVYVNYLRNKIDKGFNKKLLHTVVGMGYVLKNN